MADLITELKPTEFALWKNTPITKLFFEYLEAAARDYQDKALAEWLSDSLDLPTSNEMRGRIWCLRELQRLDLDDIRRTYGLEPYTPEAKAEA